MRTIYAGLPFYSLPSKQDYNRVNSKLPFYTPTTHLPPFIVCDDIAEVPDTITIFLDDYSNPNGSGADITSAVSASIISMTDNFYIIYDGSTISPSLAKGVYCLRIDTSTGNSYYSEVFAVVDMTSGNWCKIECSNTNDLGDILYATGGFESVYYLNTQLGYPVTETVEVGEEKDGEFITEKLVTKYIYRISDYIGRALQRCLLRLPQHDSITITDDVGNTYSPAVGNVQITSEWPSFEVCHIVIQFNDGENTAFKWTYDMTDIT
jgi:hypothetical protein